MTEVCVELLEDFGKKLTIYFQNMMHDGIHLASNTAQKTAKCGYLAKKYLLKSIFSFVCFTASIEKDKCPWEEKCRCFFKPIRLFFKTHWQVGFHY